MNTPWITILSSVLVGLGVLAELNLLRIFIRDWRHGRRDHRTRFRPRSSPRPERSAPRRALKHARVAACVAVAATPAAAALAQADANLVTGSPAAVEELLRQPLTLADIPLTLSFQPDSPAQPQPPAPAATPAPAAQPLTISTNRPSFDDTSGIVPIGHFQLETGYTFTFRNRQGVETQTHNAPEILARIPLLEDRLELQLGTSGYVWSRSDSGTGFNAVGGFSDATLGLRLKVVDEDKLIPRIALQLSTTTGLGTDGISNQDVEPTFKFIWSYDLGDGWGIYGNLAAAYLTAGDTRFLQGQAGVCLSKTLNDQWSVYAEYYVFGPNSKGTDAAHYIDVGAAYLITPRIQLDARVGFGLNQEANNVFTGFGISFLF